MHDVVGRHEMSKEEEGFLCLLCERRLSDAENYTHEFSREHVAKFLVSCFKLDTNCIVAILDINKAGKLQ